MAYSAEKTPHNILPWPGFKSLNSLTALTREVIKMVIYCRIWITLYITREIVDNMMMKISQPSIT